MRITGPVDNDAAVYVNGDLVGVSLAGYCATNTVNMVVPDGLLVPGDNVVAVRAHDYGVLTYLDLQITYDRVETTPQEQLADLREAVARLGGEPDLLRMLDGVQAKLAAGRTAPAVHSSGRSPGTWLRRPARSSRRSRRLRWSPPLTGCWPISAASAGPPPARLGRWPGGRAVL